MDAIYAVRAERVPVLITAHQLGPKHFRIRLHRGIGWVPQRFTTREAVLKQLLAMRSYGVDEARACKRICRPNP